jgi:AbiV family abortive infection protein
MAVRTANEGELSLQTSFAKAYRSSTPLRTDDQMGITAEFVIEGIILTARNAQRFLHDAIGLYESGKYRSAYILGVIASENVGRGTWMLDQIREKPVDPAMPNKLKPAIDAAQFTKGLRGDHIMTIRQGTVSLQFSSSQQIDEKLIDAIKNSSEGSPERLKAISQFKKFISKLFNITATKFHDTRTTAQYVASNDTCTSWNDPQSITQSATFHLLRNVSNNYNFFLSIIKGQTQIAAAMLAVNVMDELQQMPSDAVRVPS